MKYIALFLGILIAIGGYVTYQSNQSISVGADLRTFISTQLAGSPITDYVLSTDGTNNVWVPAAGGGSSKWTDEGTIIYPTTLESIRVPFIEASSTSATSTLPNLKLNNIMGIASAGVDIDSSNGTNVANFGVGNSANSLFYGGVNIDGQTRIATSISGLIKATSGILSAAVSGTDYVATTTGDWIGTFDGQEGSYYLARANHTGTQSSTTITGLGTLAGLSSVDISANTNLAGDSEIVLTNDTLSIASTIARDSELHSAVTLSGALDYITLVGQDIVRGAIDLATDITGALGIANGGLGAAFTDPNADQLMFWDDSVGAIKSIATLAGITISGTTATVDDVTCTDCLGTTEITDSYLLNNGDTGTGTYDLNGATVKQHTYKAFTWPGVATTTSATTTVPLGTAFTAEAWNTVDCYVTASTGAFNFSDGTNKTNGATATTTVSRTTLSSNNTFTAGETRYVDIGALTAAQLSCTLDITVNN